ncbi:MULTISPECIES: efflux RND transporter periplasmic adaptor subunit [unclassified Ectothiorhodospira]|uniref:efflux RND transporter periplasmic adaptor subunit n=1 Tax=unclassified Ectothiorhodospira TaxID=2684909 RepID=UPI001EE93A4A|nr:MULTISPECIES: efflux RND transporter periplasmic adaptor subunit [unclassified Ectothiorhodospira]MCG5516895.1 efflux RND transporter periplasmic adaptor subunit [Ectothiorhodospira sp. 9100]MCG5519857.1 efflux RND transporter periplasmic adaptor subunit [Ectothiorhodospira sp. 9905]
MKYTLFLLLLTALLGGQATAADQPPLTLTETQAQALGVEWASPAAADHSLSGRYPGVVTIPTAQLRVITARQSGVIEHLAVAEGQHVSSGDLLAEIRSPELVDTQRQYLDALNQLELARQALTRDQTLFREGLIPQRRLLETQSRQRELNNQEDQFRQQLSLAGLSEDDLRQLARTRQLSGSLQVHAPIAGTIIKQLVETGQSVDTAEPLYRLAELNPLWVETHVPLTQLDTVTLDTSVLLPTQGLQGQVIAIGSMVHEKDQGILLRAQIHDVSEQLRPGQFLEVQLAQPLEPGHWRLPATALVRHDNETWILVDADNAFLPLPVQVVAQEDQTVVVRAALQSSNRVATRGVAAMKSIWLGE